MCRFSLARIKVLDRVWTNAAIKHCLQHQIDHFFLAPGSRCTPLTLAVAEHQQAHVVQHFDERGLAFAALGYARATGKPGVFICTSGTAVANALPTVIEASAEGVPMLLFTADRPNELRGSGANQTIDQRNIFGNYPQLFLDLSAPEDRDLPDDPSGMAYLADALGQAFEQVRFGPVHLNWMFREPFTIDDAADLPAVELTTRTMTDEAESLTVEVKGNVLIALGACNPTEAQRALELSQQLNCPLLSDVTSGVSGGSFELPTEFTLPQPDTILHLGGRIVSKSWLKWTQSLPSDSVDFIHVTPTGQTINPNQLPQTKHRTSLTDLKLKMARPVSESFRGAWQSADDLRRQAVDRWLATATALSEPAVAYSISQHCPSDTGLLVGNSTPIRDMDWYGQTEPGQVRCISANRGASGIDGLLATATGYAAGLRKTTTVLLGDLSALHDLNSLALVANSPWPVIVIIINNRGGHIFDLLPIRKSQHFEQFFNTPHSFQFEQAAKMFGIDYRHITQMSDFVDTYSSAISSDCSLVLELATDRQQNIEVRQQISEEIRKCSPSH